VVGEIKDLETKLDTQFADLRKIKYHLHSVFMHRGGPSSGHYWVYIYDFFQDEWRKYNDGYVTLVSDHKEVYDKDPLESRPATPYFLVYIRGDMEEQLADAVYRRPDEPPPYTQDTVMEDTFPSVEFDHREYANEERLPNGDKVAPRAVGGWDSHESDRLVRW